MSVSMLFIIASPRSGSTMLERILSSHSRIRGGPEPHLLTPLAHAGLPDTVDAAPYDPLRAAEGLRRFVASLPEKESDYWTACRAYSDTLYEACMVDSGKLLCLDKTPAYALILPFLTKVYPDAKYVVLTRHPLATFSSYVHSFFDGDYLEAHRYNPLLERYVPALAAFLRQDKVSFIHVRYEDLVKDPETWIARICEYLGIPFEPEAVVYGSRRSKDADSGGLGDPIGVDRHDRPTTSSVKKWVNDLASDPDSLSLMREVIARLEPTDLALLGYPVESLWKPLGELAGGLPKRREKLTHYRLQRRVIVRLRGALRGSPLLRRPLEILRFGCEALLREE